MHFYAAPMEGVTTFVWRNLQYKMFPEGIDKYFTPFVTINRDLDFKKRDLRDVLPENNIMAESGKLIPQVLTSHPDQLIHMAHIFRDMGYREINLNLGCPIGTVTGKGKGSAMLRDMSALETFLDATVPVITRDGIRLSVKTRLGYDNLDHAVDLVKLFLQYDLSEIIIHPRMRIDLYKGPVHMDAFKNVLSGINDLHTYQNPALHTALHPAKPHALHPAFSTTDCGDLRTTGTTSHNTKINSAQQTEIKHLTNAMNPTKKIVYNGDLFTIQNIKNFEKSFPAVDTVMLGRGLIANPAIVRAYLTGRCISKEEIKEFTTRLFDDYHLIMPEDNNVINKMKEIWKSMADLFAACKDRDRALRDVLKARNRVEYNDAVRRLLAQELD